MSEHSKYQKRLIELEEKLGTDVLYVLFEVGTVNMVEKLLERIEELEKKVDNL